LVSSQLPPPSCRQVTITAPAFIFSTIAAVMSTGAFFPGTAAVVMTRSASATRLGDRGGLALAFFVRGHAGVAAGRVASL